ncbi:polyketide cyclase [Leptospira wolffii]|uniref:LIC10604 family protein n=1 Tax=Leptospira wolffii TaxID=409998 RepID=UPI001082973E|nr:SRPBCC family protein [Leptospira wolffii]TGK62500.1 polyketide cyclase [Leptospira wolffii]TGK66043.1 polyketide cyclase [Leptospira wolffii]TGK74115.1 polyketide cyclase [Leptospira wolffii]TGL28974.1 polyketide cyclase [Leptospira wolffii]
MKRLGKILTIVVVFVTLLVLSGYLLPRDHQASAERSYSISQKVLFDSIRNFSDYPTWRTGLESIEKESETTWIELDSHGNRIRFGIVEEASPSRLKTKILSDDLPFGGGWEFEISPEDRGSKLRITETGFVTNPLFRILSKFVFGHDATMRTFLADLDRKFESKRE